MSDKKTPRKTRTTASVVATPTPTPTKQPKVPKVQFALDRPLLGSGEAYVSDQSPEDDDDEDARRRQKKHKTRTGKCASPEKTPKKSNKDDVSRHVKPVAVTAPKSKPQSTVEKETDVLKTMGCNMILVTKEAGVNKTCVVTPVSAIVESGGEQSLAQLIQTQGTEIAYCHDAIDVLRDIVKKNTETIARLDELCNGRVVTAEQETELQMQRADEWTANGPVTEQSVVSPLTPSPKKATRKIKKPHIGNDDDASDEKTKKKRRADEKDTMMTTHEDSEEERRQRKKRRLVTTTTTMSRSNNTNDDDDDEDLQNSDSESAFRDCSMCGETKIATEFPMTTSKKKTNNGLRIYQTRRKQCKSCISESRTKNF